MKSRLIRFLVLAVPTLLLAAALAVWLVPREDGADRYATIGGPFELVDQTGAPVTRDSFAGDYLLMAFGFTYCPDVCPTELAQMALTLDALGEAAARVRPVFVTVDPARDTPETLATYLGQFHPRLVGLTGTPDQIAAAAKAYRVYYNKVEQEDSDDYLMDHSSFIYLIGPDGRTLDLFPYGTSPDDMAASIREQMRIAA